MWKSENEHLTLEQAAQQLHKSVGVVTQWCNEGLLHGAFQRLDDQTWRIPASSVRNWVENHQPSQSWIETRLPKLRELNQRVLGVPRITLWGVLVFLVSVIGLIGTLFQFGFFQVPRIMTGDFRVAVAAFEVTGNRDERALGQELAQGVYLRIEQALGEMDLEFTVEIWGPAEVATVRGFTAQERALSAARLAEEIRADMVVYGLLDTTKPNWTIYPEFYISDTNLVDAQEITGQHEIGKPFVTRGQGNAATRIDVSTEMSARAKLLSMLTVGLAYYTARDFPKSQLIFEQIENEFEWVDMGGREVLYLLIGNAAGKSGDFDQAENAYQQALSENPSYSRAHGGLGSVYYIRAIKPADETGNLASIDVDLVNQAIASFEQAASAPVRPALSDTGTKVHFGLGQAYLALHLQDANKPILPAIQQFEAVVDEYGASKNPRIRELAAEAHARLGLIYSMNGNVDAAISQYENASQLLTDVPDRQHIFESRIRELRGDKVE